MAEAAVSAGQVFSLALALERRLSSLGRAVVDIASRQPIHLNRQPAAFRLNKTSQQSRNTMAKLLPGKRIRGPGLFFLMTGLILLFGVLLTEGYIAHPEITTSTLATAAFSLLEKVALAFVVIGMIDLTLHVPALNQHFADGLSDLITKDEYLSRLRPERLTELLNRALNALAGSTNPGANMKGSFLEYFHENIRSFINSPYREDVRQDIAVIDYDDDCFTIKDTLSYICRASGKGIQPSIDWSNEDYENEAFKVSVAVLPQGLHKKWMNLETAGCMNYMYDGEAELTKVHDKGKKLKYSQILVSLQDYRREDGLHVKVTAKYRIKQNKIQSWRMSHLTRNITLTIRYPIDFDIQTIHSFQNDKLSIIDEEPGHFQLNFEQWVLPDTGIAWKFDKKVGSSKTETGISPADRTIGT